MSESTVTLRAVIKDEISAALRGISGATKGLGDDAKASGASFGALDAEVAKLSSALQDNVIKLRAQRDLLKDPVYSESARHAAALRKEINSLTDGLDGSSREGGKNATSWANVAAKYYVASQAVGVLSSGIMSLVDASKQYEMVRARLNAAEGSSALGGQDFRDVQEMAKKPGLGFQEAATTMATLRGMKVTANEAKQLINGIAQANASAAGTAEQFGRVMYQIQQSVSTGRLVAEDLRPIMQAIPTLGAAIQEHFGASQAEALNDKLKASGKSVREFWLEVSELGQKLPSTGETITNNLDNISDGWVRLRAALSDADAIKTATGLLAKFLEVSSQAVEGASARKALKKRAETNLGQVSVGYATAGIDDVVGNQSSFAIEEEMIRLRQLDFLKANNEAYDKEIKEDQERWDAAVKRDREAEATRKADALKKARETEAQRTAAHDRASEANIETNSDGSVTLRQGVFGEDSTATEHTRNREKAERADEKRAEKVVKDRQAKAKDEAKQFADTEKRKSDALKKELDRREAMYDKYAGQVQGLAQSQLAAGLRGEFSLTEARRAAFDTATNMTAQWVTESIASYIKKSIFEKEQMAVDAAAANAARAAEFAASSATAAATFTAWAPAAGAVTAATFGANADAGAVQYAAMQGIISASAMMPHARGGAVFGRASASREEAFIPLTPGRIVPAHNSVTNNSSTSNSVNHFHFHGGGEKTILRTLRKAGIDNRNVSRS